MASCKGLPNGRRTGNAKGGKQNRSGVWEVLSPPPTLPPPPPASIFFIFSSFSPHAFARLLCFPPWAQTVLACVQTSPISFVARGKGNRRPRRQKQYSKSRDENSAFTLQIIRPSRGSDGHADLAISSRATGKVKTGALHSAVLP